VRENEMREKDRGIKSVPQLFEEKENCQGLKRPNNEKRKILVGQIVIYEGERRIPNKREGEVQSRRRGDVSGAE